MIDMSGVGFNSWRLQKLLGNGIKYIPKSHQSCSEIRAGQEHFLHGKVSTLLTCYLYSQAMGGF